MRANHEAITRLLRALHQTNAPFVDSAEVLPDYTERTGAFVAPTLVELTDEYNTNEDDIRDIMATLLHEGGSFTVLWAEKARNPVDRQTPDPLLRVRFDGCGCQHWLYLSECVLDERTDGGNSGNTAPSGGQL